VDASTDPSLQRWREQQQPFFSGEAVVTRWDVTRWDVTR
jgi:hypothetical protein